MSQKLFTVYVLLHLFFTETLEEGKLVKAQETQTQQTYGDFN